MATKKETSKKGGFTLAPITLSEPVRATDGFTNLVESPAIKEKTLLPDSVQIESDSESVETKKRKLKRQNVEEEDDQTLPVGDDNDSETNDEQSENSENQSGDFALSENELLQILDAGSLDEIYELSDVLRASSLKLYATLIRLVDARGRARVKNHELMSKSGIKGIATLYKQERWLMDLKLLEKKAKPGPHDGSSYVVRKLETLPLPAEIFEKFEEYLSNSK